VIHGSNIMPIWPMSLGNDIAHVTVTEVA
jgi:hypothetical protein